MERKELFINFIQKEIFDHSEKYENETNWTEIVTFWEAFKSGKSVGGITENGQKILQYMKENVDSYSNLFKAKEIGEGLFISSRSVSGAMRKLITDGFVSKAPGNPVIYSLTNEGKDFTF